jgi:hypothetical protein
VRPAKLHENRSTSDKSELVRLTPLISARVNLRHSGFFDPCSSSIFLRSWVTGTSFFHDPIHLNPPQLPILEHAVASAAPAASYKSLLHASPGRRSSDSQFVLTPDFDSCQNSVPTRIEEHPLQPSASKLLLQLRVFPFGFVHDVDVGIVRAGRPTRRNRSRKRGWSRKASMLGSI